MDESAYRRVLLTANANACPFEKSILTGCAVCSIAIKHNIAEREIVTCNQARSLQHCTELRDSLRHNFNFTLGVTHIEGPLPHAKEMRMQCGGLKGLQAAIDGKNQVEDVAELVREALNTFGHLEDYPYAQIVQFAKTHYLADKLSRLPTHWSN